MQELMNKARELKIQLDNLTSEYKEVTAKIIEQMELADVKTFKLDDGTIITKKATKDIEFDKEKALEYAEQALAPKDYMTFNAVKFKKACPDMFVKDNGFKYSCVITLPKTNLY